MNVDMTPSGPDALEVLVQRMTPAAHDILEIELRHPHGAPLPVFAAGAHIDVHLPGGLVRQYSLCSDPVERDRYLLGVQRAPASRGGSASFHDRVKPGDRLRISAPRNLFALTAAPHSVLLAGGIGITPLLSMAAALHRMDASFELHYCAREARRLAFQERLHAVPWAARVRYHIDETADAPFDPVSILGAAGAGSHLYTCGPAGFMAAVVDAARTSNWNDSRVHLEHFGAPPVQTQANRSFVMRLAVTGISIHVGAEESALQALERSGIDVPFSCEQGVCGTCLTRVIDGRPDHRDSFLNDAERARNDCFTPCCSRSCLRELVLDL